MEVLDQVDGAAHVGVDTMHFWIEGAREALERLLPRVDTLFLNDSEAKELTGESNLVQAIRRAADFGPSTIIVKKGEHGAVLFQEDQFFAVPAFPVEVVKDPTGGGDAFAGGVFGYLAGKGSFDGASFREAMLHGTAAASFIVEEFGPRRLYGMPKDRIGERVSAIRSMITL